MFYLTTHTKHILFTVIYGIRHMVKDHSDSERGNPLPPHRQDSTYHSLCYTSRVCAILSVGAGEIIPADWNEK